MFVLLSLLLAVPADPPGASVRLIHRVSLPKRDPVAEVEPRVAVSPTGRWVAVSADLKFALHDFQAKTVVERDDPKDVWQPAEFLSPDRLLVRYTQQERPGRPGKWSAGTALVQIPELTVVERFEWRTVLALSPCGRLAVCEVFDPDPKKPSAFEVWDPVEKKTRFALDIGTDMAVKAAKFRADGKQVVVRVHSVRRGKSPRTMLFETIAGKFVAESGPVNGSAGVTADGKAFVLTDAFLPGQPVRGNPLRPLVLCDIASGQVTGPLRFHTALADPRVAVHDLKALSDGRHVVLAGTFAVGVWNVVADQLVVAGEDGAFPREWGKNVSVAESATGAYAATYTTNGMLYVWEITLPKPDKPKK